jgi:hypothetical protein
MELLFTEQFEDAYARLTKEEKRIVRKTLDLLSKNLSYPGLHTKKMEGRNDIWESRPSKRLRMTFKIIHGNIMLRNVGEHDKVLKKP